MRVFVSLTTVGIALVVTAFILITAVVFDASLGAKANPGLSRNPTKAPWYFLGFQEMLMHIHPLFALFIIPILIVTGLVSIPYMNYPAVTAGVWFASSKGRKMALVSAVVAVIATLTGILANEYLVDFTAWMPGAPATVSNGLVPLALGLAGVWFFHRIMKRKYSATRNEAVQMIFVFFVTAFMILTITGIWFRGTGMHLAWP